MIKILYILHCTDPLAGSTKAIMPLLTHPAEGIRPVVILPDTNGIYAVLRKLPIHIYALHYRDSCYPGILSFKDALMFLPRCIGRCMINTDTYETVRRIIREEFIDIVHTNTGVIRFGWHAACNEHIPHIWHIREYAERIGYRFYPCSAWHRKELRQSYTICVTKGVQDYYKLSGYALSTLIYDGALPQTALTPIGQKERYWLYAGRLERPKGIESLLRAYAVYAMKTDNPVELWIAGHAQPAYLEYLQAQVQQWHIAPWVRFLGKREDIIELMRNAYAVVIPSLTEGFGFVMPEAQFAGSLVIARNVEGLKEQFEIGRQAQGQAIGLAYENEEELSRLLTEVSEKGLAPYREMIEAGQRQALNTYSIESNYAQIIDTYKRIYKQTHNG